MPGPAYSLCPAVTSVSVCVRGPLRTGHSPAATDRCRYTGTARWSACSGIRHRRPARRRQVPGWTVRSGRRSSACLSAARPPGRRVPAVRGTIPGFSRRVRISSSVRTCLSSCPCPPATSPVRPASCHTPRRSPGRPSPGHAASPRVSACLSLPGISSCRRSAVRPVRKSLCIREKESR